MFVRCHMDYGKYPVIFALQVLAYGIYDTDALLLITLVAGLFCLPRYLTLYRGLMAYVPLGAMAAVIVSWEELMADAKAWALDRLQAAVHGELSLAAVGAGAILLLGLLTIFRMLQGEAGGRTYLNVPFDDKELAKAEGAQWDPDRGQWFAPRGSDLDPFERWMPNRPPPNYDFE